MSEKFYEEFFIEKPEATGEILNDPDIDDGNNSFYAYRTKSGKLIRWSGDFPLPEIGQRIYITMNGIGWAQVKGYFESVGYLGVMTLAEKPPRWLKEQNERKQHDPKRPEWYRQGIGCEFGTEIALAKPKPGKCQWFLKCKRAGTLTRQHPRLGELRICRQCNALVEHLDKGTEETYDALARARKAGV